jgi:methylmalonyl-CoA/ethylmalonyl-CoA epimerase
MRSMPPLDEMRFHHLGVACPDLATEMIRFQSFGYRQEGDAFLDPVQKVRGMFLTGPGPRLELLAPLDSTSPITAWIEKGIKYYHQAFEVVSMGHVLDELRARRGRLVSAPGPGIAFGDRPIAFVMLPGMILIEVIQAAG